MARILAARKTREAVVVCLDGDDAERAALRDRFSEPVAGGNGVAIVITRSGLFPLGKVVRMGGYRNAESLVGLVVERIIKHG